MKQWEDYLYSNGVLKNKKNIVDFDMLQNFEFGICQINELFLLQSPLQLPSGFQSLKLIHKTLFEDIYDWAGKTRDVEIRKSLDEPFFTSVKLINKKANEIFYGLERLNYFINDSFESFVVHIGELLVKLNDLHPFREGNGRAIKVFLNYIAISNGYFLDYSKIDANHWNQISSTAHTLGNSSQIKEVLERCITQINDSNYINSFRKALNLHLLK